MISSFRAAIYSLGSGSLLIAATALSRDGLPQHPLFAAAQPKAARSDSASPAEIVRGLLTEDAEPTPTSASVADLSADEQNQKGDAAITSLPDLLSQKPTPFQNAALRSAPPPEAATIQPAPSVPTANSTLPAQTQNTGSTFARPAVVLKSQETLLASIDKGSMASPAHSDGANSDLVTRIFHPKSTSVTDLERLIRPLLTPGVGTVVADSGESTADRQSEDGLLAHGITQPGVLIVRDRPQIVSQVDAIFADLEAAPKRVVIDALIADIALPDSVPPGWETDQSRFGVIDAPPRAVLNSLRALGRVHVIATNQLQVIDRQWAALEWAQGASQPSEGGSADASVRLATRFRLRPSILSGGLVRLEVHPTSSRRKEGTSGRPEVATVTFTTDLLLHAGATAVLAGSVDERLPESEPLAVLAKSPGRPANAPKIEPKPGVRRQTVLLLMPRIAAEN